MRTPTFLLEPDAYERHYLAARLARPFSPKTVLDVGGVRGALARFLKADITAVNVDGSGDVEYAGTLLPFPDKSFDLLTTIDVLEHIAPSDRAGFLAELTRVARSALIVAAPFGTPLHEEIEREAERLYADTSGTMIRFLREHLSNGLPTLPEINDIFSTYSPSLGFAGDCRLTFARARRSKYLSTRIGKWGLPSKLLMTCLAGNWFRRHVLEDRPQDWTNRFYAVCDLRAGAS